MTGVVREPEGSHRVQGVASRSGEALIVRPKGLSGERERSKRMSRSSWVALKRLRPMWRELVLLVRNASFTAQSFSAVNLSYAAKAKSSAAKRHKRHGHAESLHAHAAQSWRVSGLSVSSSSPAPSMLLSINVCSSAGQVTGLAGEPRGAQGLPSVASRSGVAHI